MSTPTGSNSTPPKKEEENDLTQHETIPPDDEAAMRMGSDGLKSEGNGLFVQGKYAMALAKYSQAIDACPRHLEYELAVLRSNVAVCHLKLEEWKEAVDSATAALDGLERVEKAEKGETGEEGEEGDQDADEMVSAAEAARPEDLDEEGRRKRRDDVARIRAKALLRRARARSELGGWANLEGAIEDYKRLEAMDNLTATDRKVVRTQLRALPPRAREAQEQETAEMWSKLKDLGNGLLRPFGLSTDSFKMVKDEKTGGYSVQFQGGGGGGRGGGGGAGGE
ncbi:hypothetical protein VTJ83DRAFT_5085 [Remersonia thermophila]|uniref:Tetratricopeptide repeat protein 1 n=1 Tax=Remersonia thermophila TaxID=72144 RepID=A0ABR4DBV4_9PEZI